jgi:PAS domain S-box-containing protein
MASPESSQKLPSILLLGDTDTHASRIQAALSQELPGVTVERVADLPSYWARMAENRPDLVLAWFDLATQTQPDLLSLTRQHYPDLPLLFLLPPSRSPEISPFLAQGLTDYVTTDQFNRLGIAARRLLYEAAWGDQQRAQAEAQLSKLYQHQIFENHHTTMLIIDPTDGRIVDANPAAKDYYGWSREHLRQMYIQEINTLPPEQIRAEMIHATSQQRTYFRFKHRRAYGDEREVEVFTGPVRLGDRPLLYSIIHDVAERSIIEEALKESEARFRRLAENAPDIIYRYQLAPEMGFDYVSPAATTITGYTPEEHYADPALGFKLIHPHDRNMLDSLSEGLSINKPIILRWVRKDGQIIWVEQINVPVYDEAGNMVALEGISRDITERKQAEERLALQRIAMESAANAIVITDQDGSVEWVNPAYTRLTGYEAKEIIGHNPRILKSGKQPALFYEELWETILAGEVWHGELINRRKDGSFYVEEQTITPIRNAEGEITHFVAIKQDVTARKQRERELDVLAQVTSALREQMDQAELLPTLLTRLRDLMDAQGVGMIVTAMPDQSTEADERPKGRLRSPLLFTVGTVIRAGDGSLMGTEVGKQAIDQKEAVQIQVSGANPDGETEEIAPVSLAAVPSENEQVRSGALWLERRGDPFTQEELALLVPVVEIALNTWQRAHLFQRIHAQAEENIQIMRSVPDGLLLLDGDHRLIKANPAAQGYLALLTNSEPGEVLTELGGRPLAELLTSPPLGGWHKVYQQSRIFEVLARPLISGSTGWVIVLRDVTQAQMVQDQLERQQRLAAIGQMAAGIAHDFNNLMGVIVLYAGVMDKSADLSAKDRDRLTLIRKQAHYATEMIQQILDFSRSSVMELTPMDLLPMLKEQIKLLKRTLPESIELSLRADAKEYLVKADPTRIQQVLMNLAINARDAMPSGGHLHFDLSILSLERQRDLPLPNMSTGRWLRLTVSDTGHGIPSEIEERLFQPFVSSKAAGQGTGLGLAQVHGIIAQHGGQIVLDRSGATGATFAIYLPTLSMEIQPAPVTNSQELPVGQEQLILVVEDNETLRSALVDYLRMWQYTTIEVGDGSHALDYLAQAEVLPDLILSDVVMPKMGGSTLIHNLRRFGYTIPVILITGHPLQEEDVSDLRTMGMVDWLPKPPNLQRLAHLIAKTLGTL